MIVGRQLEFQTRGEDDVIDITAAVRTALAECGLRDGTVTLFVAGSTAALTTVEYEPGVVADLKAALARLAPREHAYRHHETAGDENGHSHVRAALLGPSLVIPFAQGQLLLGTWQQVVFIDFDVRPRRRIVVAQIMGE